MVKKLFVGNISFNTKEKDIEELFSQYGEVRSVVIIKDHQTDKSRGFGFVELGQEDALRAMQELNGCMLDNRMLRINEARGRRPAGSFQYNDFQKHSDEVGRFGAAAR